jgi:hypothetical protein
MSETSCVHLAPILVYIIYFPLIYILTLGIEYTYILNPLLPSN